MSSLDCLEATKITEETRSPEAIREVSRTIREAWSPEERARRQRLAETKQVGLFLNCIGAVQYVRTAS